MIVVLLAACRPSELDVGTFRVSLGEGTLSIEGPAGARWDDLRFLAGTGDAEVEMQFGAFRVTEESVRLQRGAEFARTRGRDAPFVVPVASPEGDPLGDLTLSAAEGLFFLDWSPTVPYDRIGLEAACDPDDHFLGLGSHVDVDHAGEAFPLWTSEPGIGKSDRDDVLADDWPVGGTKHATSFPSPFVLRPHHPDGMLLETDRRVDVDLCASDPDRFSLVAWDDEPLSVVLIAGGTPLGTVQRLTDVVGRQPAPPDWTFGPWADAIRGPDRVRTVLDELRAEQIPATAIWSEDWKGASETPTGYRLGEEWFLDRTKYPDAEALAAELEDAGVKWLAYFAPFVGEGDVTWDSAVAADALVKREDGTVYTTTGVGFQPVGMVDLSTDAGRDWAIGYMQDALDLGFDGWMADYGEWLPAEVAMADGRTGLEAHATYPEAWQETNRAAIEGADATFFVRSGWSRTPGLAPIVWAGDQRTSFDADDGFPTVLPLALGASVAGVPVFTHDVAGYQSLGNAPSDRELWFRWCSLGAFTPVFRLHHGSFDTENHQLDTDPETLAHYGRMAREHARLYPYLRGLAARAAEDGTPMILPVSFLHDDAWDRQDAWMLGDALLVAPVLERGATGRDVHLPPDATWFDWWTGAPAVSGFFAADLEQIPVFAANGTIVPTLATLPAVGGASFADVDGERIVYVFGGGAPFTEADGTRYAPRGNRSGPGEATGSFADGEIEVAGLTIDIEGPVTRTYTVVVR